MCYVRGGDTCSERQVHGCFASTDRVEPFGRRGYWSVGLCLRRGPPADGLGAADGAEALEKVKGICKDPRLTDVSSTINKILYGEKGAWRGQDDQ